MADAKTGEGENEIKKGEKKIDILKNRGQKGDNAEI